MLNAQLGDLGAYGEKAHGEDPLHGESAAGKRVRKANKRYNSSEMLADDDDDDLDIQLAQPLKNRRASAWTDEEVCIDFEFRLNLLIFYSCAKFKFAG